MGCPLRYSPAVSFSIARSSARVFLDLWDLYADGSGLLEIGLTEEIELTVNVAAALLLDAVYHDTRDAQQRLALVAHTVEGTGADEVLDRAAVELPACHAAAEILEAAEGPVLLTAGDQLVYEAAAYAFYCDEAEADIVAAYGEVGKGLVHVRRQ